MLSNHTDFKLTLMVAKRTIVVAVDETETCHEGIEWTLKNMFDPTTDVLYIVHVVTKKVSHFQTCQRIAGENENFRNDNSRDSMAESIKRQVERYTTSANIVPHVFFYEIYRQHVPSSIINFCKTHNASLLLVIVTLSKVGGGSPVQKMLHENDSSPTVNYLKQYAS